MKRMLTNALMLTEAVIISALTQLIRSAANAGQATLYNQTDSRVLILTSVLYLHPCAAKFVLTQKEAIFVVAPKATFYLLTGLHA